MRYDLDLPGDHSHGRDEILGTAHSDHGLVVFLEAAGVDGPDSECAA
ncbi:hypothetical protein ABT147_20805 [Streptomyces sp. NPDC001868]